MGSSGAGVLRDAYSDSRRQIRPSTLCRSTRRRYWVAFSARFCCALAETHLPFEPDDSLVIVACPGIRREAEIVANEIWRLIGDDDRKHGSSSERLRFRDIAVLVADTVNRPVYQAHIRAVFEELHGIPFNMIDLPLAGECRVIEALLMLLAMPMGEFTRPEVLKILTHPAVRAGFPRPMSTAGATGVLG